VLLILFVGGVVVGWSPIALQPGPFVPGANSRSIDVRDEWAAEWAQSHLAPHNRLVSDSTNALLMGSYGRQDPQFGQIQGQPVSAVFTEPTFSPLVRRIIVTDALRYVVVDERLTKALPAGGIYFYSGEPGAHRYRRPLASAAVAKFRGAANVNGIFTDGQISTYDTAPLLR
jgi:hypothetical protein